MERAGASELVEHYFRHEYGRLVSRLVRVFSVRRIDAIEDAVQSALLTALTSWALKGTPSEPSAWLYRVAHNQLLDTLRRAGIHERAVLRHDPDEHTEADDAARFEGEILDDQLRMLFVCCDEAIPLESQLVLALKTLCGFGASEIALRLFTSEANVHKRLLRARDKLRELKPELDQLSDQTLRTRIAAVHSVLYLLFNEGYHAQSDCLVRRELCDEALRLCTLLVEHPVGDLPSTRALLAMMHFHTARLATRLDGAGAMLLLEEQDRSRWDARSIALGEYWLARSAEGEQFSRYHAEAGISAEHCLAPSFEATRWGEIADLYVLLDQLAPSPLHTLNRAVAVAQQAGPRAGLALLEQLQPPAWLTSFYLWHAVLGELQRRAGNLSQAREHLDIALATAPTEPERALLRKRLASCSH